MLCVCCYLLIFFLILCRLHRSYLRFVVMKERDSRWPLFVCLYFFALNKFIVENENLSLHFVKCWQKRRKMKWKAEIMLWYLFIAATKVLMFMSFMICLKCLTISSACKVHSLSPCSSLYYHFTVSHSIRNFSFYFQLVLFSCCLIKSLKESNTTRFGFITFASQVR